MPHTIPLCKNGSPSSHKWVRSESDDERAIDICSRCGARRSTWNPCAGRPKMITYSAARKAHETRKQRVSN